MSLLLLPSSAKTKLWTHADIIELVSDARSVSVGDRVLVNRGRNTRGVGIVTERHAHGNGSITYSIGPVDVPPRTRRSVGSMTNVPEHDVEHVDSLICRPGEVRGVGPLTSKTLAFVMSEDMSSDITHDMTSHGSGAQPSTRARTPARSRPPHARRRSFVRGWLVSSMFVRIATTFTTACALSWSQQLAVSQRNQRTRHAGHRQCVCVGRLSVAYV